MSEEEVQFQKDLVRRCLDKDRKAQEELYRLYADKMYNICLTYTNDQDDACDVLQDSFIKVFSNLKKYRHDAALGGWIRTIVVNTALELYRKKKRKGEIIKDYAPGIESSVEDILDKISAAEIIRVVNDLPARAAMVFKLYCIEGFSHNEISDQLEITVGTSKSQLNRARGLLSQKLQGYG